MTFMPGADSGMAKCAVIHVNKMDFPYGADLMLHFWGLCEFFDTDCCDITNSRIINNLLVFQRPSVDRRHSCKPILKTSFPPGAGVNRRPYICIRPVSHRLSASSELGRAQRLSCGYLLKQGGHATLAILGGIAGGALHSGTVAEALADAISASDAHG
jgi:hypothetical protein